MRRDRKRENCFKGPEIQRAKTLKKEEESNTVAEFSAVSGVMELEEL